MADFRIGVEKSVECTFQEAKQVVAGFCFGTTSLVLQKQRGIDVEAELGSRVRPRWAYRIYDCIQSAPDESLNILDVLMTAGTNSQIHSTPALGILSVLDKVNETLFALSPEVDFWDLKPDLLRECPPASTPPVPEYLMWKAWCLLDAVDGVGPAIASKVLHHKRPNQFPVLDSLTLAHYPNGSAVWSDICVELQTQSEQFMTLEGWFNAVATRNNGRMLTRLRLHDILLWAGSDPEDWNATLEAGQPYL